MNMALDESLLRSALEGGVASLRFYTWTEPTLSLGYFQHFADRKPLDVAWVRRPTGGDAIMHHHEITYSLALPSGAPWHTSESWICRMHHAVATALQSFGIAAMTVVCGEEQRLGPMLCFQHQTPGDLLIAGHKVAGSAQRRPHGAMLQHGSILLIQSEHAPELPGIAELSGVHVPRVALEKAILHSLAKDTGWSVEPSEWTQAEREVAEQIEREKYSSPSWNEKR